MVRAAAAEPVPDWSFGKIRWGKFVFWLIVCGVLMILTLFVWNQIEQFLIGDDRFRVAEAEDYMRQSPNLTVKGVRYASPSQVRHIFADDFGRSLYLVPIQKRREELLAIDWVEEATVSKIWPNTIAVDVRERTPVAFVHFPPNRKDGLSQFALVDREGYILRPRIASKFTLPVITGLRETDPLPNRRARVRRVLNLLNEVGGLADQISEINATDLNDLVASERVADGIVSLMLGDENYADRLKNFLGNYDEIRAKKPDVKTFDLRIDGVITAVGGEGRVE